MICLLLLWSGGASEEDVCSDARWNIPSTGCDGFGSTSNPLFIQGELKHVHGN